MKTTINMSNARLLSATVVALLLCSPVGASGVANYEGLVEKRVATLDHAQFRPDVLFSVYTGVILDEVRVAYRTPDRSQQEFPLDDGQKQRFNDALDRAFLSELTRLQSLQLMTQPGRDVLRLRIRVQDVTATVPPRSDDNVGDTAMALQAVGEVTLVLELFDSRSGEILARAVDTKAIEGAAMAQDGGMVTRWPGVEQLCAQWASTTRMRLEALIGGR